LQFCGEIYIDPVMINNFAKNGKILKLN